MIRGVFILHRGHKVAPRRLLHGLVVVNTQYNTQMMYYRIVHSKTYIVLSTNVTSINSIQTTVTSSLNNTRHRKQEYFLRSQLIDREMLSVMRVQWRRFNRMRNVNGERRAGNYFFCLHKTAVARRLSCREGALGQVSLVADYDMPYI